MGFVLHLIRTFNSFIKRFQGVFFGGWVSLFGPNDFINLPLNQSPTTSLLNPKGVSQKIKNKNTKGGVSFTGCVKCPLTTIFFFLYFLVVTTVFFVNFWHFLSLLIVFLTTFFYFFLNETHIRKS